MKAIQGALSLVKESRRAYIALNVLYYGLIIGGMIYVAFDRSVQKSLVEAIGSTFTTGPLALVGKAYTGGQVLMAIVLTFVVNLGLGSFAEITLPSLVIPFSGLLVGAYRAVLWGLIFSPPPVEITGERLIFGALTLILLILEGQGYVLTMLAAYIQGKAFISPQSVSVTTHRQGYWVGVKRSARLYLLVVLVLAVAAVYEATFVILVPKLG